MGYAKKGSKMSLLAGLTFGGLLVGSGVLISQGESYQGHALASGTTGVMTVAMGQRFLSTGKFMPAGMVASLGAIGLAYNVKKTIEWMPGKDGTYFVRILRGCTSCLSPIRVPALFYFRNFVAHTAATPTRLIHKVGLFEKFLERNSHSVTSLSYG